METHNAVVESFFYILKVALVYGKTTMPVRKLRQLFLNIYKGCTIGNAVIPILGYLSPDK
jgi:hypothetical protein